MKCLAKFLAVLFIAALLFICVSCVNTRRIRYGTITRPPKPADSLIEILDAANINRPFKVIGLVRANAGKQHNTADVIEQLRNEARKLVGRI